MDEDDAMSPVPSAFDGIELKTIDPGVLLGQLIAAATGSGWSPRLVGEKLIWPEDGEQDMEHEGPWVTVLDDGCRDALAAIPAGGVPGLAEQWATAEEFHGHGDPEFLREVIAEFAVLAGRAREKGESLYCWMSL